MLLPHHAGFELFQSVFLTMILISAALIYLWGWLSLRSSLAKRSSVGRAVSFLGGLFLIWVALASPIAALDHELLTIHMLQHLLLMTIAPPLIWLASPFGPVLHGLPQRVAERLRISVRHSQVVKTFAKVVARPRVCWLAACTALIGWHTPKLFALGMQSASWHLLEQLTFLATGLMFWWPVVQSLCDKSRQDLSMILYLFFATLPCDILSGFLAFSDRVVYPMYFSSSHLLRFSPLVDQQCAAALMWTCVTIVYVVAGAVLTMRLLSPQNVPPIDLVQSRMPETGLGSSVSQSLEAI
jgi:putative membrane protein